MNGEALQCDTKLRNDRDKVEDCNGCSIAFQLIAILAGDHFKFIFMNENNTIPIRISLKFVTRSRIDNKPAFVQVMAWRRTGDKPLHELVLIPVHWRIYAVNLLSIYNPGIHKHSHVHWYIYTKVNMYIYMYTYLISYCYISWHSVAWISIDMGPAHINTVSGTLAEM